MEDELAKKEKKTEEFKEELRKAMEDIGGRKIDQDLLQLENETKAQNSDPHELSNSLNNELLAAGLLDELDNLEEPENEIKEPKEQLAKLNANILENHKLAVSLKSTDKKAALEYIQKLRKNQDQKYNMLNLYPELLIPPKLVESKSIVKKATSRLGINIEKMSAEDIEEKLHNLDKMGSVMVMQKEIELMEKKIEIMQKKGENPDYYEQKKEILEMRIDLLQGQVQTGLYSMEKYISDIYTSLTYENALLKELTQEGALGEKKGPVIQRIKMRIQLMEEELAQQPDEDEDEEEEGVVEENKDKEEKEKELEGFVDPDKVFVDMDKGTLDLPLPTRLVKEYSTFDPAYAVIEEKRTLHSAVEDSPQYKIIIERFEEYRDAAKYFIELGNMEKADKFLKIAEELDACGKSVQKGKDIDLSTIPKAMTPQLFHGISEQSRVEKFTEIIDTFKKEFGAFKAMTQEALKNTKRTKNPNGRIKAEEYAAKAKLSHSMAIKIKNLMRNEWQPLPVVTSETEYDIKQKMLFGLKLGVLRIFFENDPKLVDFGDYSLYYNIDLKDTIIENELFIKEKEYKQDHEVGRIIRVIDKKDCIFTLKKKSTCCSSLLGSNPPISVKLPLEEFSRHCEHSHDIIFQGKSSQFKIKIKLQIRQALRTTEEDKIPYKKLIISQIPPPFKTQGIIGNIAEEKENGIENKEVGMQVKIMPEKLKLPPDPPLPLELPDMPISIREIDVKDPDNIGNYISLNLLDIKVNYYTEQVKKISQVGKKVPPFVINKLTALNKNNAILRAQIEKGKITKEQYSEYLDQQVGKDEALVKYLKPLGQNQKIEKVEERLKIIKAEIQSAPK